MDFGDISTGKTTFGTQGGSDEVIKDCHRHFSGKGKLKFNIPSTLKGGQISLQDITITITADLKMKCSCAVANPDGSGTNPQGTGRGVNLEECKDNEYSFTYNRNFPAGDCSDSHAVPGIVIKGKPCDKTLPIKLNDEKISFEDYITDPRDSVHADQDLDGTWLKLSESGNLCYMYLTNGNNTELGDKLKACGVLCKSRSSFPGSTIKQPVMICCTGNTGNEKDEVLDCLAKSIFNCEDSNKAINSNFLEKYLDAKYDLFPSCDL